MADFLHGLGRVLVHLIDRAQGLEQNPLGCQRCPHKFGGRTGLSGCCGFLHQSGRHRFQEHDLAADRSNDFSPWCIGQSVIPAGCEFRPKLDSRFQPKLDSDSKASWTLIPGNLDSPKS
jgi:hypothetical protein